MSSWARKRLSIPKGIFMRKPSKKVVVGVAAVAIALGTAGGAYAYWSSTGTGTGSATTGTSTTWAVTSDAATGGALTPGGPTDTIAVHVKNNNSGVQNLTGVTASVANSDGSAWAAVSGCSAADYTVSAVSITPGEVASGATVDGTVTITMKNLGSSQDGCKSAVVPLYFSAS
jgi:hypothetical protein